MAQHMLLDCQWPTRFLHGTRCCFDLSIAYVAYMLLSQPGGCQIFIVPLTGMYSMFYTLSIDVIVPPEGP